MKNNNFLLWVALFVTQFIIAQNITIPDANFKKTLINLKVDENGDGEISKSEASKVTKLDVSKNKIKDLAGIEYFTNITTLSCHTNELTNLDISIKRLIFLKTLNYEL